MHQAIDITELLNRLARGQTPDGPAMDIRNENVPPRINVAMGYVAMHRCGAKDDQGHQPEMTEATEKTLRICDESIGLYVLGDSDFFVKGEAADTAPATPTRRRKGGDGAMPIQP